MRVKLNLPGEATFKGPAMLWKRLVALILDFIIIEFVIGVPFRSIIMKIIPQDGLSQSYSYLLSNPRITALLSSVTILFGLLALLYFAILEYKTNQTIGKTLMNIKVESVNKELTFLSCLIRSMYLVLVFPFILLWLIDPLFIFFTKDKRRLSEILSKTRTVEVYSLR